MDVKIEVQGQRNTTWNYPTTFHIKWYRTIIRMVVDTEKQKTLFSFFLIIFAFFFPTMHFRVHPIFSFFHVYDDERGFSMSCFRILIQDPRHRAVSSFISPSSSIFASPSNCFSTSSSTSVSVSACTLLRSHLNLWGRFFKASNVPGNTGGSPVALLTATSNWWDVWRWWRGGKGMRKKRKRG